MSLFAIATWLGSSCPSAKAQPVLQSVFDGKDLAGWGQKPAGSFIVNTNDHCIQVSGTARGFVYTTNTYLSYRVLYSVRQLNHLHWPCALFFGFNTNLDAMGAIQFQLPNNSSWDYRPGHNLDPHKEGLITSYGTVPNLQQTGVWYRCEILVHQSQGTADSAAGPLGGPGYHITKFTDPTITNVACPFAFQSHQSGVHDEFKDVLIETNPQLDELVMLALRAPSNLQATAVSPSEIDLSWDIVSTNQTGFEVFHSLNNSTWDLVATLGSQATSYSDTGLTPNSTYYYRVSAIIPTAISDYSTTNATTPNGTVSDFTISATPLSQTVVAGCSTNYTVNLGNINAFTGTISLSASGLPTGVGASFSPASTTAPGSSTLTVTTSSSTPAANSTLTITGASGSVSHSTNVTLHVTDFSLSVTPSSQTVTAGNGTTYTVAVGALNGFSGIVSFNVSGLPSGASASFNPASVTGSGSSTLSVTTTSGTAAGTYPLAITGTSSCASHTATITLTVNPANTNNFAGTFELQNEASLLVLNNQGSLTNGSPITQWTITTSSNLDWTFIATSNGYYQINSSKSGRDAVVQSASTAAGAKIIQWSFGSSGDDQWKPVANSDGSYTFFNLHSGLVLSDPGGSTNRTTQMDQETSNGGSNQKWNLLKQ